MAHFTTPGPAVADDYDYYDYNYGDYYAYNDNMTYEFNYTYYYETSESYNLSKQARETSNQVFLYVGLPIILFGTLGNLLSLAVLQTRAFQQTSSGFLLSALALTDTGVLNTGLLRHWILAVTGDQLDIRAVSAASCKIHTFLTYMLLQLSAWTLVLMTVERLLSVVLPMRSKEICSRARIVAAWVVTLIVVSAVNLHMLFTMQFSSSYQWDPVQKKHVDRKMCYHSPKHDTFWTRGWPWLDNLMGCMLPGIIILATNIAIVRRLATARRERKLSMRAQRSERDSAKSKSVTAMLISISVLFLLTTIPSTIYLIGFAYWPTATGHDLYRRMMGHIAVTVIHSCNYALNFVMYCVSGAKFRKALLDMVCCRNTRERRRGSASHLSVNTTSSSVRSIQYLRSISTASNGSVRSAQYSNSSGVKLLP